jgi:hypothetical protein
MGGKSTGAAPAAPTTETAAATEAKSAEVLALQEQVTSLLTSEAALNNKVAALETELADAADIIADLKDQLANGGSAAGPTAKVGNEKYLIVGGFRSKGKEFTPQDIAADSKIVAELVKKGSTLVQKIG